MISKQIAEHAISSTEEWERKGMYLKPVPGSLLEKLVMAATLGEQQQPLTVDWIPSAEQISEQSAGYKAADEETISEHDSLQKQVAAAIAAQIQQHFNFARNNVRPIILQTVDLLRGALTSIPDSVEYSPNLILVDLPKPMNDPELQDVIQAYRSVPLLNLTKTVGFAEADIKKIIEYAAPGSRGYDNEVATWMAGLGEENILSMWNAIFGLGDTSNFAKLVGSPTTAADAAMFTFAIATTMLHNSPEGLELTRDQITTCGQLREQAAIRMCYATDEEQVWIKNQRVLLTYTKERVRVSGTVYRDWIENGGSNAILFGSILSDRPSSLINALNEKAGEYITNWERHNKLLSAAQVAKRSSVFQEALYVSSKRALGANLELAFAHAGNIALDARHPGDLAADKALKEICVSVREEEFADLYQLARRVICDAVFPYSNALEILKGVDEAKLDNPDSSDREAALVMLVQLVTRFIRAQIEIGTLAAVK